MKSAKKHFSSYLRQVVQASTTLSSLLDTLYSVHRTASVDTAGIDVPANSAKIKAAKSNFRLMPAAMKFISFYSLLLALTTESEMWCS